MSREQPRNWGTNSNATYYSKKWANQMRPLFQSLLDNPKGDILIDLNTIDTSPRTFQQKLYQTILYIIEEEKEKAFESLKERISVRREGRYLRIMVDKESSVGKIEFQVVSKEGEYKAKDLQKLLRERTPLIQSIKAWIDTATKSADEDLKFRQKGRLTDSDMTLILNLVERFPSIKALKIDKDEVFLVKNSKIIMPGEEKK